MEIRSRAPNQGLKNSERWDEPSDGDRIRGKERGSSSKWRLGNAGPLNRGNCVRDVLKERVHGNDYLSEPRGGLASYLYGELKVGTVCR